MKIASVADVKAKFSAYIKASDLGPVVITRNGKAVAAIISMTDEDIERLLMSYSPKLRAILGAARRRIQNDQGVEHQDFWRQMQTTTRPRTHRKSA